MNALCKTLLLAFLSAAVTQPVLLAQSPEPSRPLGCMENHRVVAPKNPRMGADGSIVAGQVIVQAKLALDENTAAKIVESPRSGNDLDSYNSTVIVQHGQQQKKYPLEGLIKGGSLLRLVEIASVCGSSGQGTVFLAFEAGTSGAAEGFVVIRYSPEAVDVQALPMANQGRIVVTKATPNEVELWSASGSAGGIDCDACKKHYSVRDCNVRKDSIECQQRPGAGEVLSPDKFMRARIDLR
jgi:hypothetical protein